MDNKRYFSQYESPNIVIIPTMSCKPPSPKRRKIGNNIIVPIVNNAVCENLISAQEKNSQDHSNVNKKVDKNETSSKSPKQKSSWAANYLQSIGLDKKSSILNRRIPRKPASQECIFSVEPPKNTSEPTPSYAPKIDIDKNTPLRVQNKIVTDSYTLKDSKIKNKSLFKNDIFKDVKETKSLSIKDLPKNYQKYSNHESNSFVKNTTEVKNNKKLNVLTCKNKNICNDFNKIKTDKIKQNDSSYQTYNHCTSVSHSSHTKSRKIINKPSQKDTKSKLSPNNPLVRQISKSENKVVKSNIKSVVIKEVQGSRKCNKTKRSTRDNVNQLTSSSSKYKEKEKVSKYPTQKITSKSPRKNIKVTKTCERRGGEERGEKGERIGDFNMADVLRKTKNNTEHNFKSIHNKSKSSSKTKSKEKLSKIKLDKKTSKSPIKRKTEKTKKYRKIKLVINLICNKNSSPLQCNESSNNENNSGSKTCTISNVDLDFLNDFNIDEIVESLDICEKNESQNILSNRESNIRNTAKQSTNSNVQNFYNHNDDAIDLIKILKGEEDDDLMRISTENPKELLFRNVVDNITRVDDNSNSMINKVSKSGNSTISYIFPTVLIKEEEKKLETLETVSCNAQSNVMIDKNVSPVDFKNTFSKTKIYEKGKESSQSPIENVSRDTSRNLAMELDDNKNENNILTKEEQNVTSFINEKDSSTEVNSDSNEKFKLDDAVKDINQENIEYDDINTNKSINSDQNENKLNQESQIINTDNPDEIFVKENSNHLNNLRILQADMNCNGHISNNESTQDKETYHGLHQQHAEAPDNQLSKLVDNQHANETCNSNEKCMKAAVTVQNSENENNTMNENSLNQTVISQQNENAISNKQLNNTVLINNAVEKEAKVLDRKVQEDAHETNKEECNAQKDFKENNQNNLQNNTKTVEPQSKLSDSDAHPHTLDIKGCQENIQKLEERLYNCSGSKYSINSLIHTGKFSKIFKCKHPNGKYYALKMLTTNIKYNVGKEKKDTLYSLISDIPKNNLFMVNLIKAFDFGGKWCYLTEYYPKNLQQALDEAGKSFSIDHIQDFARQLITAVLMLRNKNMVHLDINPKHILINSSNNMLKLSGFDNLCYINKIKVLPNLGTVNYRAPEVILGYESDFEIDVWSTGLVLYEMAANRKLFPGCYNNDILYKQLCTLGSIPYDMLKKSRFGNRHFIGSKFMRRSGFKGKNVNIVTKFYKNNRLCNSIYEMYYENWGQKRSASQKNCDIGKINLFVKLLQKMLTIHPESRLPIAFVYADPFIYDTCSYQKW